MVVHDDNPSLHIFSRIIEKISENQVKMKKNDQRMMHTINLIVFKFLIVVCCIIAYLFVSLFFIY